MLTVVPLRPEGGRLVTERIIIRTLGALALAFAVAGCGPHRDAVPTAPATTTSATPAVTAGGEKSAESPSTSADPTAAATTGTHGTPSASPKPDPVASASATNEPRLDVAVAVTRSGWDTGSRTLEVGGLVPGLVEEGGICTLTLERLGARVESESRAVADVSSTSCGTVRVSRSQLSSGAWTAWLGYRSSHHAGRSEPFTVEVP